MIGLSLPYRWLLGGEGVMSPQELLPLLKQNGAHSVEMRPVPAGADPDDVLRCAELLWNYGFNITAHGSVGSAERAVEQVLRPLKRMIANMKQRELVVTVHPILGDNVQMLLNLSTFGL